MKKTITTLAASMIALTGCATGETVAPPETSTSTSTSTSTYTTAAQPTEEYTYDDALEAVQNEPALQEEVMERVLESEGLYLPPGMAADYAEIVCDGLRDGADPMDIAAAGYRNFPEYDIMDHALLVGASVGSHCVDLSYIIEGM